MNNLQDRALKIWTISHVHPTIKAAVDLIEQELRTTRDEGIETGLGQTTRHEDILEEWSRQPAYQEVVEGIRRARARQAEGQS